MFIREVKNRSGSISIQIISKVNRKYIVIKSIGSACSQKEIAALKQRARHELQDLQQLQSLFISQEDILIESFLSKLTNDQIHVWGPELIFGKIYDHLGYAAVPESLFRHLVITRLAHPGSKLKTIDYLYRFQGIRISIDTIYRFLDKLHNRYKEPIERIAFEHTARILGGQIGIVFYDMTTLYFEASDEDDLRRTGFSKEGRHQHPQIYLGLLVSLGGYPIGYDIFEGNIYEGHTLIPTLSKFEKKYHLSRPIIVADAGLLSSENLAALEAEGYRYILGSRIKNESQAVKQQILSLRLNDGEHAVINKDSGMRLIVTYSDKRAAKDERNRQKGLQRLEKNLKAGRLTKSHLNNRGYNKYLRLVGRVQVEIDYEKFNNDQSWDGLKGYITNTLLPAKEVIDNYNNLWQIEKAFRISKTDLRIRPIYHRLKRRIEAHICIAFTAYSIYKELERVLQLEQSTISVRRAADLTHTMYCLDVILPDSKQSKRIMLNMDKEQKELLSIINKHF